MTCYPTHPHYDNGVLISPCPILLMMSARLSSDKYQFCTSLIWLSWDSKCLLLIRSKLDALTTKLSLLVVKRTSCLQTANAEMAANKAGARINRRHTCPAGTRRSGVIFSDRNQHGYRLLHFSGNMQLKGWASCWTKSSLVMIHSRHSKLNFFFPWS